MTFAATILTLYPEMFPGPLGISLAGRALVEGKWSLDCESFSPGKGRPKISRRCDGLTWLVPDVDRVHFTINPHQGGVS